MIDHEATQFALEASDKLDRKMFVQNAIGAVWEDVAEADWSGWYPLLSVRRAELRVIGLIEADRENLADLVPVVYTDGMVLECAAGEQIGFMLASDYARLCADQEGGAA